MRINVEFSAQIKDAAQQPRRQVEVPAETDLAELVRRLANEGTRELRALLLNDCGAIHSTLLLFVGDELIPRGQSRPLQDGETVAIMSPMSGG